MGLLGTTDLCTYTYIIEQVEAILSQWARYRVYGLMFVIYFAHKLAVLWARVLGTELTGYGFFTLHLNDLTRHC